MTSTYAVPFHHNEQHHSTLHRKGSFSHYLASRVAREAHMGAERAPLHIIEKYSMDAEEQFQALRFFYSCVFRKQGKKEEVKRIGGHNYKPLSDGEKQKIVELKLANVPLLHIAIRLDRHISTIHYFCKREKIL